MFECYFSFQVNSPYFYTSKKTNFGFLLNRKKSYFDINSNYVGANIGFELPRYTVEDIRFNFQFSSIQTYIITTSARRGANSFPPLKSTVIVHRTPLII